MIRFLLKCDKDHRFESWFASNAAFDQLQAAAHLSCAICGSATVEKALMAPAVAKTAAALAPTEAPAPQTQSLAVPDPQLAARLQALRDHVEANSSYVGTEFVKQAREMHLGDLPERPIHGEARIDEARALLEDGIPVAPLPFLPTRKTN